jgi:hypothetical protein
MKFPILDSDLLARLPKSRKPQDMGRILSNPNSEDYVTWNVFTLLKRIPPERRWPWFAELANQENPAIPLNLADAEVSTPQLWNLVSSPKGYENASRLRMMQSENEVWRKRAQNPKPVEGSSEIDIVIETDRSIVLVEAKLGSDASKKTTYDPLRNQVARNIDCLLDTANGRTPFYWMIVRDRNPQRNYVKLMTSYQINNRELVQLLPHRTGSDLVNLSRGMCILLWRDLVKRIVRYLDRDRQEITAVLSEIDRRI